MPRNAWCFLLVLPLLALSPQGRADERLFGFSYGAEVLPKGGLEYEQWITDLNGHASGVFNRMEVAEELEYGVLDRLSGSLYLHLDQVYSSVADPSAPGGVATTQDFGFDGVSMEWKYLLLSPETDPLGLLLYFEPRYSGEELELEGKLVLQRNLGERWVAVCNVVVEQEYGFYADQTTAHGEPGLSLGLAYKVTPVFSLSLEAKEDMNWADNWGYEASDAFYLGPGLHLAVDKWWASLAVLGQLHGQPESIPGDGRSLANDNPDVAKAQVKLGLGVDF